MPVQLSTPRVRVLIEQPDQDEYLQIDVQTDNRDMVQWDATRPRRGWAMGSESPVLWMTFLAWHAIRRTGGVPGYQVPESFDEFSQVCVATIPIDAQGEPVRAGAAGPAADPTPPGLGPG